MRPVFALALFLGVIFLGSIFAEEAFDCSNTTTCALPCTYSSNATKIFHWYIGETLSWNCTLGEKCPNATSADINFCFKGNVPDHLTRVVDSRTKELRIANVTEDYVGSYFCYVSGCLAADIEMQIAYPAEPPDVKVFYDVLNDMAQNLTVVATPTERNKNVNWTWDIRYRLNTRRPQYFYDDFNDHCTEKKNWSCDSSLEFPCGCPESKFPGQCTLLTAGGRSCFEEDMNHTIHVKMSSTLFGSAHTNVNVIPSNAIARAPNVYDVSFNESSRQVEVRWSMWSGLSNMRYRVSYRRVGSEPWKESMTNETSLMIRGLVTNTPYQANISAKFDKSDIWSKPELKDFNTTEDVPSESPKLSVGSYMHDVSPDCGESGQTSLVLYTKPIPKESENGKLLSIAVNVKPPLPNQTNPVESPVANQTIVLCGVRRDQDYEVELKGRTKMGLSKVPSSIVILSKAPLKPIQVVAEKLNSTTVHVRWTVRSDAMHNVTIHLCQQFDRHSKCLTGYDWLTVMGPVSSHNVTVANLDQTQSNFRFGVSVEVGGVSSGIAWSSCLYDRPSGPGEVTEFQIESLKTSMTLKWSPPDCHKLTSFPSSYTVSYGAVDTTTENSSAQCDSVAAMLQTENVCLDFPSGTVCKTSLESLKSGQMYFVCVHGISDDKSGKWVFRRAHTPDNTNLGLIVGFCIGGTVLIGIIIICCRLFCLSQNKKNDFTYPEAFRPLPDLESSYYAEINGYHTVSTEICNGESPIHTGYGNIPNGVAHHSTNGGFNILSVECPDSPGPGSSGPGSTAPGSTESGSPVPLLFHHQLPQGDLQEQISDASSNPNVSSQDLTRNNLPDRVSPEVEDSPGSDLSEDNVLPGPADSCSAGDTQLQTPGEHSQDRGETEEPSYDTDEEYDDTDWTDESDQYKKPKMAQTEDFDVFQDSSSSLQGKEMSGSTTELLTKHRAAEERKDLVGKDNFGGPASRSNSMTSYARLSSVRQGTSTSDSSSDHTVPFPTKTRVTEEELVKQKALERHRAGVEETETRTEQTSV